MGVLWWPCSWRICDKISKWGRTEGIAYLWSI